MWSFRQFWIKKQKLEAEVWPARAFFIYTDSLAEMKIAGNEYNLNLFCAIDTFSGFLFSLSLV
jgi:hypothetical protein